ncbi:hypothetical protein EVAR_11551_1 [Eumeta japonica]|uniref:Uncharacterized protein n=1 Tax=Eumeta variegata TaxID=151549 RepID=A0A4C1TZ72_EUMVA|nr:hypothetical protein EVAR_11551_1 [Eumeta japonica]
MHVPRVRRVKENDDDSHNKQANLIVSRSMKSVVIQPRHVPGARVLVPRYELVLSVLFHLRGAKNSGSTAQCAPRVTEQTVRCGISSKFGIVRQYVGHYITTAGKDGPAKEISSASAALVVSEQYKPPLAPGAYGALFLTLRRDMSIAVLNLLHTTNVTLKI